MPSEGNRATKDSSLFLFISHPVWFWVFVYFFFFFELSHGYALCSQT